MDDSRAWHHSQRDAQGDRGGSVGLPAVDQFAQEGQDDQAPVWSPIALYFTTVYSASSSFCGIAGIRNRHHDSLASIFGVVTRVGSLEPPVVLNC